MEWAYGVTATEERLHSLLPKTLSSLAKGGFPDPWLFVDGATENECGRYYRYKLTTRSPRILAWGNWYLALSELRIRFPNAARYALFQDDCLVYPHLREYLEQTTKPERYTYWNLFTTPNNQELLQDKEQLGWYPSDQRGRGAVALVFTRQGVDAILCNLELVQKPNWVQKPYSCIDGAISEALQGYTELVHNPSLCQHTAPYESAIGNHHNLVSPCFRGLGFDPRSILSNSADSHNTDSRNTDPFDPS